MPSLLETICDNYAHLARDTGPQTMPDLARARRWADAMRRGEIFFYDKTPVKIGLRGIDWQGRHIKHQEWPAQFNRFFWLPHLAALYQAQPDEALARIARATIEDWIEQHNYCAQRPPDAGDNTLNLSIRLGQGSFPGWWGTAALFAPSKHYDEAFIEQMANPPGANLLVWPIIWRRGATGASATWTACCSWG